MQSMWAADLPLSAQAYFCDTRCPLRGIPIHAAVPLKRFLECLLTAPLPLTPFSARSAQRSHMPPVSYVLFLSSDQKFDHKVGVALVTQPLL